MSDERYAYPFGPPFGPSWPDGEPVHDRPMFVRLSCGHSRMSRGWRGGPGEAYCCDVCKVMTTIVEARDRVTGEESSPTLWRPSWALPGLPSPSADQLWWSMEYIRKHYGEPDRWRSYTSGSGLYGEVTGRVSWRARRRVALRLGKLRVRLVWRWDGARLD